MIKEMEKEFISYACDFQALLCVNGMAEELLKDDFDGGTWQKTQIPDSDGIIWYKKALIRLALSTKTFTGWQEP